MDKVQTQVSDPILCAKQWTDHYPKKSKPYKHTMSCILHPQQQLILLFCGYEVYS